MGWKISDLQGASLPLTGNELIEVTQGENSRSVRVLDLLPGFEDSLAVDLANKTDLVKGMALVGYRGRTAAAKLFDYVTPKDFGAVGDGVADDTAALQAALDASLSVNLGGPGDVYKISGTLVARHKQHINGCRATVIQTVAQTPMFNAMNKSDVTIENGVFIGVKESPYINSPSSQAICITAQGSVNLTVRCNRFIDFCYSPVMTNAGAVGLVFCLNEVEGPGATVLSDPNYRNTSGATLIGKHMLVANNRITKTAQGLIIGQASENVVVIGNVIHDLITEHGMYCDTGVKNLSIVGNTVRNVPGVGIKVQHYDSYGATPSNIAITGNTVEGTTFGDGILIINTGPTATPIKAVGVTITGNTCRNIGQDGIAVRHASGAVVSGNTVFVTARYGMNLVASDDVDVTGNTIRQTEATGIFDDGVGTNISIIGNSLNDVGRAGSLSSMVGIYIAGGVERFIHGNRVKGDPTKMEYALWINGGNQSTMTVSANYLGGAKQVGARFKNPVEPLRYFGQNQLEGAAGNDTGLYVPETAQRGTQERLFYGTAAPTTGTWQQGARMENRFPAAGGPLGWVCVAGGTPGTWKVAGTVAA